MHDLFITLNIFIRILRSWLFFHLFCRVPGLCRPDHAGCGPDADRRRPDRHRLPFLPADHGLVPGMAFIRPCLWPADVSLDTSRPLWGGTLSTMKICTYLHLIHPPWTVEVVTSDFLLSILTGMYTFFYLNGGNRVLLIKDNRKRLS